MAVNIGKFNQPQLYNYQYDQLNRLVAMDAYRGYNVLNNNWSTIFAVSDFKERVRYDGNGNILGYLRNGTTNDSDPVTMDSLNYQYFKNTDGSYRNNRLRLVRDNVALGNYSVDIDDQLARVTNAADSNYVYDAIGNLVQDKSENITDIQWNVYGKIQKISKTAVNTGDVSVISYWYDAAGNRIGKKVESLNRMAQYTWYTRDASGNVMGVYQYEGNTLSDDTLRLKEHHLYGSSRIGVWNRWINMDVPVPTGTTINLLGKSYDGTFERGNKFFELSNHLGNVLATISDKKFGHNGGSGVVDYYDADVVTASDYYPFGMVMPGRQFGQGENFPGVLVNGTTTVNGYTLPIDLSITSRTSADAGEYVATNSIEFSGEFESGAADDFSAYIADGSYAGTGNQVTGGGAYGTAGVYRYGFNGKENDNELKGVGNQIAYENRIYDPRIGRWYSLDPLQSKYPNESHYAFVSANPILYADKAGLDKIVTVTIIGKDGKSTTIQRVDKNYFKYSADYRIHELPNMPGKEFVKGYKQNVYENYIIDLNNPQNSSYNTQYKTIESFNFRVTYFGDMLFSKGDESDKERFGYFLFGQGHDMSEMKGAPRAASGSEAIDIDKLLSTADAWREFGPRTFEGDEFKQEVFQFMKNEKWKAIAEAADNLLDGAGAVNTACNNCGTEQMTELFNEAVNNLPENSLRIEPGKKNSTKPAPIKLFDDKTRANKSTPGYRHSNSFSDTKPDTIYYQKD